MDAKDGLAYLNESLHLVRRDYELGYCTQQEYERLEMTVCMMHDLREQQRAADARQAALARVKEQT
jgi:hypothetical protein